MMYDVVIIGAGVIGSAIARETARYNVSACVIEKEEDVCCGTSKANSAIVHAGFDATPGSLKAKLNVEGSKMMEQLSSELDFPYSRNGSLVVCTSEQDPSLLLTLREKGIKNGVVGLKILDRKELLEMEPNLADDVMSALYAPTGAIVCPFHLTMALAENAYTNGVEFYLNTKVESIEKENNTYHVKTNRQEINAKIVINAAGVYADELNNMVSQHKFHITARKGEYMLLDKAAGDHVSHTIFQLPSKMGKGVLVSPTVHGNLIIGPTAVDIQDKDGINTTREGLDLIGQKAAQSVKDLPLRQVITSFAGLRAHEDCDDFIIEEAFDSYGFINVAGIESPGLSSAPAIGVMVAEMIRGRLSPTRRDDFIATRKGILRPDTLTMEDRNKLIKEQPAYGNIICRCEMITEGEIIDAIHRPLGARSLDALKRRTRAGSGRCQAGFCSPRTMDILEREVPMQMSDITKCGGNSNILCGHNKDI
jgi:glycerol-3-phosphate dehydrogenase